MTLLKIEKDNEREMAVQREREKLKIVQQEKVMLI